MNEIGRPFVWVKEDNLSIVSNRIKPDDIAGRMWALLDQGRLPLYVEHSPLHHDASLQESQLSRFPSGHTFSIRQSMS
jgi:hypothetical protein